MDESQAISQKKRFFSRLPVFLNLQAGEIAYLAGHAKEYRIDKGGVIAFEKDITQGLYILLSGSIKEDKEEGEEWFRGDYLQTSWLFSEQLHPATLIAETECRYYLLLREDFMRFLDIFPPASHRLRPARDVDGNLVCGLPMEEWKLTKKSKKTAKKKPSRGLYILPEEIVLFSARRSRWFLFFRLFGFFLSIIVIPLGLFAVLAHQPPGSLSGTAAILVPGIVAAIIFFMGAWRTVCWSLDRFLVSNKYVHHRKVEVKGLRTEIRKVPIDQIKSVEVVKEGFFHNLVRIGRVIIKTTSVEGDIVFEGVDRPLDVCNIIKKQMDNLRLITGSMEHTAMRKAVEQHFGVEPASEEILSPQKNRDRRDVRYFKKIKNKLRKQYGSRVFIPGEKESTVITYRKSLWTLLFKILPLFILITVVSLIQIPFVGMTFKGIVWVLLSLLILWLTEDWRNDRYQLNKGFIVDINRKPLGLKETRNQARLLDVQNIRAEQNGIIASLFNYGNVIIETGANGEMIFPSMNNPWRVQSDLFSWREYLIRQQGEQEGIQRKEEYGVLLDVYHQEQMYHRIPLPQSKLSATEKQNPSDSIRDEKDKGTI